MAHKFWFVVSKYRKETNAIKKKAIAKMGAMVMSKIDNGEETFVSTFEVIASNDVLLGHYAFTRGLLNA